jgi:hypothetical protein
MTILLRWLIEHAWGVYVGCAVGVLIYVMRALMAHREQSRAMFKLEEETAIIKAMQAWTMVFVFIVVGAAIFLGVNFALPEESIYNPDNPLLTPTPRAGVEPFTPEVTSTITPTESLAPTFSPLTATATLPLEAMGTPSPTPLITPTEAEPVAPTPTSTPTEAPPDAISGQVQVRFGDFAALTGYSLPSVEVTTAQPLPLTLYWQALEGTSLLDYIVFTHLLSADGRLLAQHDGLPGDRPPTEWETGETIEDLHPMKFLAEAADYTGQATIAVGFYDPDNPGDRVLTSSGNDYTVLPFTITIVPQ